MCLGPIENEKVGIRKLAAWKDEMKADVSRRCRHRGTVQCMIGESKERVFSKVWSNVDPRLDSDDVVSIVAKVLA